MQLQAAHLPNISIILGIDETKLRVISERGMGARAMLN